MAEDGRSPVMVAIDTDLDSTEFKVGVARGFWRLVDTKFPVYVFAVTQVLANEASKEYFFRFELDGYPAAAPKVLIWDVEKAQMLEAQLRPNQNQVQRQAFKDWGDHTVYRPWERCSGAHNNWNSTYPKLAWNPTRKLTFPLNDLHQILNRGST
jgi:hypothetical protein